MTRPNKLEHLSLKTLSSQILEFDGKAKANQIEHCSDASFLGKLLVLQANVRLDWKVIARYTCSSLFGPNDSNEGKKGFITLAPGVRMYQICFATFI
jgi:hypothetical protein